MHYPAKKIVCDGGNWEAGECEALAELYSGFCLDASQPDTVLSATSAASSIPPLPWSTGLG